MIELQSEKLLQNPSIMLRRYNSPTNSIQASVLRWGEFMPIRKRKMEILDNLVASQMPVTEIVRELGRDTGDDTLLMINRLSEPEAEQLGVELITRGLKDQLRRSNHVVGEPVNLYIGSSLAPLNGSGSYAKLFLDELGLPSGLTYDVNAACSSGGVALLKALANLELQGKQVNIAAVEFMMRLFSSFDIASADVSSGQVFNQAASFLSFTPGKDMNLLGNKFVFFEKPDLKGYLAAKTNYDVHATTGYSIVEEGDDYLRAKLPEPKDGRIISMVPEVGQFFKEGALELITQIRAMVGETVWSQITGMVSHFPNPLIMKNVVRDSARYDLLPPLLGRGMNNVELYQRIKSHGFEGLDHLSIHPKKMKFANAPAANTLIAFSEALSQLHGKILFITFGAAATFAGGVLEIP